MTAVQIAPGTDPVLRRPGVGLRVRGLLADQAARFAGVYLLAGLIVLFGVWVPSTFLTTATARAIIGDPATTLILALGLLVTLSAGAYDLSIAQNLGFAAVLTATLLSKGHLSLAGTAPLVLAAGLAIGAVNGFLVSVVGVNSFIATLGTSSVLLALTEVVTNYSFVGPVPAATQHLATALPFRVPVLTVYAVVGAAVVWYVLHHTPVGRRLQATGANADASRLAGIRTQRYTFVALTVGGGIGSLAGLLVALKIGSVSPDVGPPYLLPAFAACFLGSTQIRPGRFNVWGTVLAVYLLATGVKGLQLAGGQLWVTDLFNGVALVGAVSIAVVSSKRRRVSGVR